MGPCMQMDEMRELGVTSSIKEMERVSIADASSESPSASSPPARISAAPTATTPSRASVDLTELSNTVWYEFLTSERSAFPVTLSESDFTEGGAGGERLVMKPGVLDDWTPMRDVLPSQRGSVASNASTSKAVDVSDEAAELSNPTNVKHGVSVRPDPKTGGLVGLPEAWTALLPDGCAPDSQPESNLPPELRPTAQPKPGEKLHDGMTIGKPFNVNKWKPQFGLPPEACETVEVNNFAIPILLVKLYGSLKAHGGLDEEGIFRLAPDAGKCDALKEALNTDGTALERLGAETDAHVLANLIKIWFRMLPERLLGRIGMEQIAACESGQQCMDIMQRLPTLQKGIFLWLLEMMADVAEHGETNRMSERAIAIVVAPNLYEPPDPEECADPMKVLTYTQGMAKFVTELLVYYIAVRTRVHASSGKERKAGGKKPRGSVMHQQLAGDV